jgi:hypothetical protein
MAENFLGAQLVCLAIPAFERSSGFVIANT